MPPGRAPRGARRPRVGSLWGRLGRLACRQYETRHGACGPGCCELSPSSTRTFCFSRSASHMWTPYTWKVPLPSNGCARTPPGL